MSTAKKFVVIGGGPAGSTVSTLLAEAGHDVLVLEASKFPRFAVGEIIAPTGLWRVWHRLGISQETLDELFIRKFNGGWQAPDGTIFQFEQDVHPDDCRCRSFVYSVERSTYDKLLLDIAREKGVTALEQARVLSIVQDDTGRAVGVRYSHEGEEHEVACDMVIDGSGRANVLSRLLDLRMDLVHLHSFAMFAHYDGVKKDEGQAEGDVRLVFMEDKWFWWAPLKGPRGSIGLVANRGRYYEEYLEDPEAFYERHVRTCPFIWDRIKDATRVTGFRTGKDATFQDYHYTSKQMVGEGWAMVGDAFGFVDPIFSAGLYIAQASAIMLADTIIEAAKEGDLSAARLKVYEETYEQDFRQLMGHIQAYAEDYFRPEFVNFYLGLANRHPKIRQMYIDTFVAYDPAAIKEYSSLVERYFDRLRSRPRGA